MAYILKYQGEFDSISEVGYRVEILEKDYSGPNYQLQLAAAPVVHNWNTDDPKAPVKGSSLSIKYLNKGSIPIESFYSNADDQFQVVFYQGSKVLFVGYLVQDDCTEPMVDYTHEVLLSANDNLGLLKDIELNISNEVSLLPCMAQGDFIGITVPVQNWIILSNINFTPAVGTPFTISGHPVSAMNGTFTPISVTTLSATQFRVKISVSTGDTVNAPCSINGTTTIANGNKRLTLANIIHACLVKTGIELDTHIYCNLFAANNIITTSFLHQTYIEPDTFLSGEKYDNCYSVLEKICGTFNLSLFQALGRWNIVHWDELRRGTVNGFVYDYDFALTGTEDLQAAFDFGFHGTTGTPDHPTYPEAGLVKSITRPFEYSKETFNYQQPKYLLKNYDLQTLGAWLRTYTVGTTTVREYTATSWEDSFGSPAVERFIRVVYDNVLQREAERYIVLRGATFDSARSVQSKPIEVTKGDTIKFSFKFRTNLVPALWLSSWSFALRVYDGTTNRYLDDTPAGAGDWISGVSFTYSVGTANLNEWQTIEMSSSPLPFSGFVYCYLTQFTPAPQSTTRESQYSDLRFEYTSLINDSTKIIGHIHKDLQPVTIKNNKDVEIYMDDSPRNTIQGTLFQSSFTGLLQDRTDLWYRSGITESKKVGNIITNETLQYRSVSRTKLEGSYRGLRQSGSSKSVPGIVDFYALTVPSIYYAIHAPSVPSGDINVGDTIIVTGSASNNGTFTVISIWTAGSLFPVGSYMVAEVVVTEPGVTCTLTYSPKILISLLVYFTYAELPNKKFIFGNLEIDYRQDRINNSTGYELFNDSEIDVVEDYSFTYIYDTK
jgi:hypothetical protein